MARMIPREVPRNANYFEKEMFERLAGIPDNKWTVFSQFMVERFDGDQRPRELDFVILIPESYSVVYLEVKSGKYFVEDRQWFVGDEENNVAINPSPPEQAKTGMWTLKDNFHSKLQDNPMYGSLLLSFNGGVGCRFDVSEEAKETADINKGAWILGGSEIDGVDALHQSLRAMADKVREQFGKQGNPKFWNDQQRQFAAAQLNLLEQILHRPGTTPITVDNFFSTNLDTLRQELLEPTQEQNMALQLMDHNDRCIIDGAAGTGKTVLAMEFAKRLCEDQGQTVAIMCSNPELSSRFGKWTQKLSTEGGGKVIAGTPATLLSHAFGSDRVFMPRHIQRIADLAHLEGTLKQGYLDSDWKHFVDETLADLEDPRIFDCLIVDEAQNLADEVFLTLMDRLLKGGLGSGKWVMFGDFVNQNIVTPRRNDRDGKEEIKRYAPHVTYYRLRINCRNTEEVANAITKITGIESPELRGIFGPPVEFKYFDSEDMLADMLTEQMNEWESKHFRSRQIIMLTSEDEDTFHRRHYGKWKLINVREPSTGIADSIRTSDDEVNAVRYSDVFDFQGLESDLVILVMPVTKRQSRLGASNTLPEQEHMMRILYTGMSRANMVLVVMADVGYQGFLQPPGL